MQKTEPQNVHAQSQPAAKRGVASSVASPLGGHIAQLEAMMDNSPRQVAQKKAFHAIRNSSLQTAQHKKFDNLFGTAQRIGDEEPLQGKFTSESPAQLEQQPAIKSNNTGLPDSLKSGIENLSGMSMDNVKVHYNSSQPAQLNALAYAQGTDIHVAPGQEQHLPHEAWHVVQQAQGRVQPTLQMKGGVSVNDDKGLEHEADAMGRNALAIGTSMVQMHRAGARIGDQDSRGDITGESPAAFPMGRSAQLVSATIQRALSKDYIEKLRTVKLPVLNEQSLSALLDSVYGGELGLSPGAAEVAGTITELYEKDMTGGDIIEKIIARYESRKDIGDDDVQNAIAKIIGLLPSSSKDKEKEPLEEKESSRNPSEIANEIGSDFPTISGFLSMFEPEKDTMQSCLNDKGFRQLLNELGEGLETIARMGISEISMADSILNKIFHTIVTLAVTGIKDRTSPSAMYMQGLHALGFLRRLANIRLRMTEGKANCHYTDISFPLIDSLNSSGLVKFKYDKSKGVSQPEQEDLDKNITGNIKASMKIMSAISKSK